MLDYERAYDWYKICPVSLYLYYVRVGMYCKGPHSQRKNRFLNSVEDYRHVVDLAKKYAKYDQGVILTDPHAAYEKNGCVVGIWPLRLYLLRADFVPRELPKC